MSALSLGITTLARTCYGLPLAAAFVMKTVGVLEGFDSGGMVIVLYVEAVSPRGVVDRRVLTADVEASLGLITCERR